MARMAATNTIVDRANNANPVCPCHSQPNGFHSTRLVDQVASTKYEIEKAATRVFERRPCGLLKKRALLAIKTR